MERRDCAVLVAICFVVAPVAFGLGRWSDSAKSESRPESTRIAPKAGGTEEPRQVASPADFASVTIENLGHVEFDQAYQLLRSAPKEALGAWSKRLEALPVGPRRTAGIKAFFKTLAQIDAKSAVDLALSLNRHDPRWAAIGAVAVGTPAMNLREVARMYTAVGEKKLAIGDFVHQWSRSDPAATATWLSSYDGEVENRDIAGLLANWAAVDADAAREWLAKAGASRDDAEVYAGFYSGLVEADPGAAFTELSARAPDEKFKKVIETVAKELFKDGPESASALISALPAGEAQETAVGAIVQDVTAIYLGGGPELQADEVAKWLLTLPESLWREQIGGVIRRWPEAAQAKREPWLEQLPLPTRDKVLADYAMAANASFAVAGFQTARRITDRTLREETFRKIVGELGDEERQYFHERVQLSPEEAKALRGVSREQ